MGKRIISILLMMCLCISVLAGCGASGGASAPSEAAADNSTAQDGSQKILGIISDVTLSSEQADVEALCESCGVDFWGYADYTWLASDKEKASGDAISLIADYGCTTIIFAVKGTEQIADQFSLQHPETEIIIADVARFTDATTDDMPSGVTEETDIEWSEFSYTLSDQQGYTFEVTYKVSPWILLSNTELINSAWSEVGGNKELPTTYGSWGLEGFAHDQYVRQFQLGTEACAGDSTFGCAMTDMYYCMGTVEIKNVTEGWSIGANQPYSPTFFLPCLIDRDDNALNTAFSIGRIFYTDNYRDYANNVCINARMTQDNWGPATFVIMAPEYFSPKYPSGVYLESMQNGFLITSPQQGAFWYADASDYEGEDRLYLGVYGKNGTYTPPFGAE